LRAAAANERRVQQQYEAVVSRHLEDGGRKAQELKDRAEQVGIDCTKAHRANFASYKRLVLNPDAG
jgi:hypothetical protein